MHVRYSLLASQATTALLCCCGAARPSSPAGDWITPRRWRCWSFVFWLPGRAGAAGYRPSALAARAGHPPADSCHRSDADWRLFGLLLRGDGQRRDAGTYRHHHGDPAHPYALRGGAPPAGAAAVRAAACLAGLVLLVWRSLAASPMATVGILFALAALLLMTFGALWQKRSRQAPADVLPLQYAVSLGLCLLIAPVSGYQFTVNAGLIIPVLFLGLLISVVAQLLLYRLLSAGNIVNVTSLFYLVPAITALLDYLLLGNRLPAAAMIGMMAIVGGIVLVFRTAKVRAG